MKTPLLESLFNKVGGHETPIGIYRQLLLDKISEFIQIGRFLKLSR